MCIIFMVLKLNMSLSKYKKLLILLFFSPQIGTEDRAVIFGLASSNLSLITSNNHEND